MHKYIRRRYLHLVAALIAAVMPVSAFADSRPPSGTNDLRELARELERIFGEDAVDVVPSARSSRERTSVADVPELPAILDGSDVHAAVQAMNRERARKGLPPLRVSSRLTAAAESKADHMQRHGYFDHVSPDGLQPADFATTAGYRYSRLGENLAVGFETGDGVVDGWMSSRGHRANILGQYTEVGVASLDGSPVNGYRGDTWVAIYGTR